ncbi:MULTISPECIES: tail assembly chaperone [unclassified Serratia (in: enterobacteria)]|uniref:tail fiber assembly protein n=1 Tax=unclassified Serratia (in: enterobacteria) TaxID=2647522 RepID=UPI000506506E|nr:MULTISPECIES: tail assembly chaperone [unclassified Serratia (in: enterobacteria)]KFK92582.1 hypothetical protein JV45_20355 [Serratia sp. Ag2]KFK97118.1 hypothetical protein IV04_17600 [Serratia sp. Ag1]
MADYIFHSGLFFPVALKSDYQASGDWPMDGVGVSAEIHEAFSSKNCPEGRICGTGPDGMPAWSDIAPLTGAEKVMQMESQRNALLTQAQNVISIWQTELQLGLISDKDKKSLIVWIEYIQKVRAIDTSTIPVNWPELPA